MYFIFSNSVFEKDSVAAFASAFAGFVFFFDFCFYLISNFSLASVVEDFTKMTSQSNLYAFFVSLWYLFKPNHRIFSTNFFPLMSATLLWFAGLGFWFILFPVYFIDLGSFLMPEKMNAPFSYLLFMSIWNHAVTQMVFLFFFYYTNQKSNFWHLTPVKTSSFLLFIFLYLCSWIVWNVIISFIDGVFPTYGMLTNFNPYTKFTSEDSSTIVFGLSSLMAAHFASVSLVLGCAWMFSSFATSVSMINLYEFNGEMPKNPSSPLKGLILE